MNYKMRHLRILNRKDIVAKLIERKKNFPLGDTCNKLHALVKSLDYAGEEIRAYHAPSECMDLVVRNAKKHALGVIKEGGFLTPEIFFGVLNQRISSKAIYSLGFECLFNCGE